MLNLIKCLESSYQLLLLKSNKMFIVVYEIEFMATNHCHSFFYTRDYLTFGNRIRKCNIGIRVITNH